MKFSSVIFKNKTNINIRRSNFLKTLSKYQFNIHNGKIYHLNDPIFLTILLKSYPFYNFNLGQFSNTRQILNRRSNTGGFIIVSEDLKKKRGIYIKNKNKKKKFIFRK